MKKIIIKIVTRYLAYLARGIYNRFHPYVIGITGSSGKTTTKYLIGELLKKFYYRDVYIASGNMNTEYSLPLAIIGYEKSPKGVWQWISVVVSAPFRTVWRIEFPKYLVLEYAADKPGDMEQLLSIVKPDIAVITNFGVAHLEAFGSMDNIANEKWKLALAARDNIVASKNVISIGKEIEFPRAQTIIPSEIGAIAKSIKTFSNKTEFDFYISSRKEQTEFELLGEHNVRNLELSVIVALLCGIPSKKIFEIIPELKPQSGRGKRIFGRKNIVIIDESYNANPLSMIAALKVFSEIKLGRKVAILGEMREIGHISEKSHREVAKYAKEIADFTIGVGDGFRDLSLDKWYPNVKELKGEVENYLKSGDVVLIKGSLSNSLSELVDILQ